MWYDLPEELELRYYDLKLNDGAVVEHIHPTDLGHFYSHETGIVDRCRVVGIRYSDRPLKTRTTLIPAVVCN